MAQAAAFFLRSLFFLRPTSPTSAIVVNHLRTLQIRMPSVLTKPHHGRNQVTTNPYHHRPPTKTDKVYIPAKDFPEVNFVTQLLGPRGRSLVELNTLSGASIFIRGKGSVKEGSRRRSYYPDDDEPLHCLIKADTQEKIDKAKELLNEVIAKAATTSDEDNDRKRQQLRQLAINNGTFRDDERRRENIRAEIVCRFCNLPGHIAPDCMQKKVEGATKGRTTPPWRKAKQGSSTRDDVDTLYAAFLMDMKD